MTTTTTSTNTNMNIGTTLLYPATDNTRKVYLERDFELTPEFIEKFEQAYKDYKEKEKNKVIPRPNDPVKKVYFNYDKDTTTIVWKDGVVTTIKCGPYDNFDEEKAIALCFMKKFFDNRGCFNSFMEKYIANAEEQ